MAEKGKRQRGCPANSAETRADRPLDLAEVVRAEVGKFAALDVAPHEFGGIELRRVARQALNGKPRALSRQVRGHVAAFMRRQAIPDQEETPTAKMILELVQEADERDVVVTARPRLEEEATAPESHRNAKPTARESFAQVKAWIRTGVSPRGAHVRRTGGRCETPLSSWKTIQARRRRAFFLPRASASSPSAGWPARSVPSRVWPDV